MRIEDYIRVIRKRWLIIALVAVTAAAAAFFISWLQTPLFRSHTEHSATFNRLDTGAASINGEQIFNNYRNRVYNPDSLQLVADQLQLDKTGDQLMELVAVQPQPTQSKFVIEVEYYTVEEANRIANAVGEQLNQVVVEQNRNLTGEDRVSLSQTLSPRFVGYTPNKRINTLAGGILGLVVGILLVFGLEYMDDTLKSAADIERYTELVTIGAIPSGAAQGGRTRLRLRPVAGPGMINQASPTRDNDGL